jgi:hypothetical protein
MRARILTTVILAAALAGCTPQWARDSGNADVLLMMSSVLGQAGGSEEQGTTQLLSDVMREEGIFNDNAELTLRSFRKNPIQLATFAAVSGINDVLLERYVVRYYRADGRSVPGVDVPFDISGEMSGRIPPDEELITSIIVVRHQAKLEPPLRNLLGAGGQQMVTIFAEITVFGRTLANKKVTASGRLEIVFADFGDEN